jgi:hypothetical protein
MFTAVLNARLSSQQFLCHVLIMDWFSFLLQKPWCFEFLNACVDDSKELTNVR